MNDNLDNIYDSAKKIADKYSEIIKPIKIEIKPLEETLKLLQPFSEIAANSIASIQNVGEKLSQSLMPYLESIISTKEFIDNLTKSLKPLSKKMVELGKSVSRFSKPFVVLRKLTESQYVCWDYFDDDLIGCVINENNTNKALRLYHEKEKYKSVFGTVDKCLKSPLVKPNEKLFEQSINAFKNGNYNLAVVGLTAVIDYATPIIEDKPRVMSLSKRLEPLVKKVDNEDTLDNYEFSVYMLVYSFTNTYKTFGADSDFTKPEPKGLNRHWIMHGRSKRRKTKLDCVKLINFLYGIILLDELSKDDDTGA